MGGYAWVTLATNDSYSLGALVLAHSLRKAKTAHKAVVLITPAVSQPMREQLQTVFDVVKVVDVLDSKDEAHLALMQRPELGITFTKIHCWRMTEFDKCVFLDADTLVVRNCDELFEREEFSAAPDVSWPDCFNSGVFVYKPSVETFNKLLQFAVERGSFDGGDQGLLNQFFSDWATEDIKKHLPFVYNLTSVAAYSYIPAFKHYGAETRIVHFIGAGKPWLQQLDPATRAVTPTAGSEHLTPLLQQWWDLFCEKVHPALDKNLESNNDGISHPPVEACSNSLPIALTDDSQTPRLIEPCTPYREKDDFRQYNLPYQPFDVRGSSGELLNVEFLLASVVQPTPRDDRSDEQQRQEHGGIEETNKNENGNEKESGNEFETGKEREDPNDSNEKENRSKREIERQNIIVNTNEHLETQKETCERTRAEEEQFKQEEEEQQQEQQQQIEEQKEEPQREEQSSEEPERPSPPPHPFDYNSFFPDEACISNYLEQNVITYQPYDSHHHHHYQQPNKDQHHHTSERSCQHAHETGTEVNSSSGGPQPEESSPALPRFLTIPEDDRRQSGNVETSARPNEPEAQSGSPPTNAPAEEPQEPEQVPQVQEPEEKRELTKSKSMPYLRFDVTEVPPTRSVWKSQPDVSLEGSRRYSMPKLKPILPRQNSLSKSVPSAMPKVTLYTEFLMSAEYKDPADLPKDKVGFVEKLISRGQLRRSKSAADVAHRFGPLPYASPETEQPTVLRKTPSHHLDNELYDLSQCKRQMGNKPKTKTDRRKENSHPLPALKPLGAPKDKKSVLIKKRKSKELSPSDGGREKILKREPRKPKDRKRETKIIPRNVAETSNGNNVNDILKRLREFSKNYQHFFGEVPQRSDRTRCRNAAMQTGEAPEAPAVAHTSEGFLKTCAPTGGTASKATQTAAREEKSVDLEFKNFRNYVQEKSKTSQKGLLGIQELVSKPEEETAESVKVLTEAPKSSGELKKNKVDGNDTVGSGRKLHETVDEQETLSVDQQNSSGKDEAAGELKALIITDSHSTTENSNEAAEINSVSSFGAENFEPFARDTKPTATVPSHSKYLFEEISAPPTVNGGGESVPSSTEEKTSGSAKETFEGEKAEVSGLTRNEVSGGDPTESFERETSSGSSCVETSSGTSCVETSSKMSEDVCSYPKVQKEVLPDKLNVEEVVEVTTQVVSTSGKSLFEESESDGQCRKERSGEKAAEAEISRCGPKDRSKSSRLVERPRNPDEILCVPDFDTPRTSRVTLPAPGAAAELPEELAAEAAPPRAGARQGRSSPRSPALPNGKPPPDGSQDGPPPSPPRATPNGTPLPPAHQELPTRSGIAGAIAQLSLEATSAQSLESATAASTAHQEYLRRQNWETGNMDYMGRDSFDNIWSKICQTLEGKDLEEAALAAAAAVSPKTLTDPSTATSKEETGKPEQLAVTAPATPSAEAPTPVAAPAPVGETPPPSLPAAPSPAPSAPTPPAPATTPAGAPSAPPPATPASFPPADPHKCPEYIDTLPGDPVPGPAEDDEIIFSKADDRPSRLTNISEEREAGAESSAKASNVKLSDILGPKESARVEIAPKPSEQGSAVAAAETKTAEGKAPVAEDDGGKPQPVKTECTTVAICQQPPPPLPPTQVSQIEKKTEKCTTVAVPSPPIVIPGAPLGDKGKGETAAEKFEPIPLPPPETPPAKTPETAPLALREDTEAVDSPKEEGKQKEGVISKILKIVGVTPKEKNGGDISKSVFYDLEGAATPSKQESPTCESESGEAKKKAAVAETQLETLVPAAEKEAPLKRPDEAHIKTDGAGKSVQQVKKDGTVPFAESKETKTLSPQTVEQTGAEVAPLAPGQAETGKNTEQKASESEKSGQTVEKAKPPVEKPARNVSPKKQVPPPTDVIHSPSPKNKSPSPKLALPQTPPVTTAVTLPTPPPQTELPPRKDSALLKVDETIPETPPVPQTSKEGAADAPKSKVFAEVDDIIDKAKNEVESLLQDRRSAEKNSPEGAELMSTMKLMVGDDQTAQPPTPTTEVEELKVTSEEDRVRHKSEVPSSKLSDQILKAIPPPRRKAISESSAPAPAPAPAIPSPPPSPSPSSSPAPAPAPASTSAPQPKTPKGSKSSSIPVPPPRNRGKPQQTTPTPTPATPSKGKPKK